MLRTIAPGVEAAPRTAGATGDPIARGERVPALRPDRRRALREDGPQRDRVRDHGRLRRGPERAPQGERRQAGTTSAAPSRRRCATRSTTSTTSTSPTSPRSGGAGASSRPGCSTLTADALSRKPARSTSSRPRLRQRRGPLDGPRRRRGRRSRPGAQLSALRALRITRRRRVRGQAPLGDALGVRRTRRTPPNAGIAVAESWASRTHR